MTEMAATEQNSGIRKYFKNMALATVTLAAVVYAGFWAVDFIGEIISQLSTVTPLELASVVVRSTGAY